jgi:hypothetical protein
VEEAPPAVQGLAELDSSAEAEDLQPSIATHHPKSAAAGRSGLPFHLIVRIIFRYKYAAVDKYRISVFNPAIPDSSVVEQDRIPSLAILLLKWRAE